MPQSISVKNVAILLVAVLGSGGAGAFALNRVLPTDVDDGHKAIVRALRDLEAVNRSMLDTGEKRLKVDRRNCLILARLAKVSDDTMGRCLDE